MIKQTMRMKGNMSRTIESIAAHQLRMRRPTIVPNATKLTANWQNGFEAGAYIQRKLRLTISNRVPQLRAN